MADKLFLVAWDKDLYEGQSFATVGTSFFYEFDFQEEDIKEIENLEIGDSFGCSDIALAVVVTRISPNGIKYGNRYVTVDFK